MKLNFQWQNDGKVHTYCIKCHSESVSRIRVEDRTYYHCASCRKNYDRWIKLDPSINWWIAKNGEYWHEGAGVFVRNKDDRFLFFERTVFPFALTVPSGHVDTNELPLTTATRELKEEIGLSGKLLHIATEDVIGDACCRGSDAHRWHAYLLILDTADMTIEVREEGKLPCWLTLDEATQKDVTFPVKQIIIKYKDKLIRAS